MEDVYLRQKKIISVFRVTGLKNLGSVAWVGTHIFFFFFLEKHIDSSFMHFERHLHVIIFFS